VERRTAPAKAGAPGPQRDAWPAKKGSAAVTALAVRRPGRRMRWGTLDRLLA